jgi:hypothetical protein
MIWEIILIVVFGILAVTLVVKKTVNSMPKPAPGEFWAVKGRGPWPKKDAFKVEILDVKDGWVRYKIGSLFDDERAEIKTFIEVYAKCEET